jgi:L-lysine exporter family protein LysE/ArgO
MHHQKPELVFTAFNRLDGSMDHAALVATLAGVGFGLSLIVAIGAQNAFVLRQGLRGEHVLAVVLICAVSDIVLIALGIAGIGGLLELAPWLVDAMRIGGAAFLLTYAVIAGRRALHPGAIDAEVGGEAVPLWPTVTTAVALTWLNPHVYLDTILLLGSVAGTHGDDRWWFGVGAALGSVVWFASLGFGARLLRPLFARPMAWRVLDGLIAIIMAAIALSLLHGLMDG